MQTQDINFKRGLDEHYCKQMKNGQLLSFLRNKTYWGEGIHLQIRNNYINLYYTGRSLMLFRWLNATRYEIEINSKYCHPAEIEALETLPRIERINKGTSYYVFSLDDSSARELGKSFTGLVDKIKSNIRFLGGSQEAAFEQLFIDANYRDDASFLILDRQIQFAKLGRLDVLALSRRGESNEFGMDLIELKYGEDPRIPSVFKDQLIPYRTLFQNHYSQVCDSYEIVIQQKIQIQKWPYGKKPLISRDPDTLRCIAVLGNLSENHEYVKAISAQASENVKYALQNYRLTETLLKP